MTEEQVRLILPEGYPHVSDDDARKFEPVWAMAFNFHRAHSFAEEGKRFPRKGIISPIPGHDHYCTCYERAYNVLYPTHLYLWWREDILSKAMKVSV